MAADWQTWPSRADAERELEAMRVVGWPKARVVSLASVTADIVRGQGYEDAWCLEAAPGRYMRRDGYIR